MIKNKILPLTSRRRAVARAFRDAITPTRVSWYSDRSFKEPFFIVGAGRCGTTLLRRLLQASPEVHIPPENWAMGSWVRQFGDYRATLSWTELSGLLSTTLLLNNQGWFDCCPIELLDELRSMPEQEQTLADFIDRIYRFHGNSVGAKFTQWGDKTPANVNHMRWILKIFPNARFIFMQRDPADVVYSWSKRRDYFDDMERPALRWKRAFESARDIEQEYKEQIIQVRYEQLVMAPEVEMERIANFLEIDYKCQWLNSKEHFSDLDDTKGIAHLRSALEEISGASVGKGRKNLSSVQLGLLQSHIAAATLEAGYTEFIN